MNDNSTNSPSSPNAPASGGQHPLDALASSQDNSPQSDLDQAAKDLEAQVANQSGQSTPATADTTAPAAPKAAPASEPQVTIESPTQNPQSAAPTPPSDSKPQAPQVEEHSIDKPVFNPPEAAKQNPNPPTPAQPQPTLAEPSPPPSSNPASSTPNSNTQPNPSPATSPSPAQSTNPSTPQSQPQPAIANPETAKPPSKEERKQLEEKAKGIVKDKSVGKAPKEKGKGSVAGKVAKIGGAMAALAIAAAGVLAGTGAIQIPGIGDIRQQAAGCPTGWTCNGACADQATVDNFNNTWCDGQGRWMHEAGCGGTTSKLRSEGCGTSTPNNPSCATGWSCNGACADQATVDNFNNTWCDGQGRWMHEAGCGGTTSKLRSEGCGTSTPNNPSCATGWSCNGACADQNAVDTFNSHWCDGKAAWLKEAGCGGGGSTPKSEGCDGSTTGNEHIFTGSACDGKPIQCVGGDGAIFAFQTCQNPFCTDGTLTCAQAASEMGCYRTTRACGYLGDSGWVSTQQCPSGYVCDRTRVGEVNYGDTTMTGICVPDGENNQNIYCEEWVRFDCPNQFGGNCTQNRTVVSGKTDFITPYCGSQQIDCNRGTETFEGKIDRSGCNPDEPTPDIPEPDEPQIPPKTTDEPTPPPAEQSMVCSSLTPQNPTPKKGDTLSFTCNASAQNISIATYKFRYNIDGGTWNDITPANASATQSKPLTIQNTGTYTVQCQACSSDNQCTPWQPAN